MLIVIALQLMIVARIMGPYQVALAMRYAGRFFCPCLGWDEGVSLRT